MKERRVDQYDTDSGPVVLTWHEGMSNAELNEVVEWLGLMQRKLKRLIKTDKITLPDEPVKRDGGFATSEFSKYHTPGSWDKDWGKGTECIPLKEEPE